MRIKGKGKSILTRQRLPVLGSLFTGLLDEVSGAAAAYSIRLLRADYSGGLVRVRAFDGSSDQGEADVLPDSNNEISLNSELTNRDSTAGSSGRDVSTLGELVDDGGANYDGFVSKWYDQTPNANHATNSTASEQPQIVSAGSLIKENGKPALFFDGNDDNFLVNATISSTDSSYTFLYVGRNVNGEFTFDTDNPDRLVLHRPDFGYVFFDSAFSDINATKNKYYLIEWYFNKSNTKARVFTNNSLLTDEGYNPVTIKDNFRLCASIEGDFHSKHYFQEFIAYSEELENKRTTFKDSVNNYYGIF